MRLATREIREEVLREKIRFQIDFSREFSSKKTCRNGKCQVRDRSNVEMFLLEKILWIIKPLLFCCSVEKKNNSTFDQLESSIRDSVRLTKRNSLVGRFSFVNNRLNIRSIKEELCSTVFLLHFPSHTKQWKLSIWWKENKIDLKHLFDAQLIRQIFEIMKKLFVKRKLSFFFPIKWVKLLEKIKLTGTKMFYCCA